MVPGLLVLAVHHDLGLAATIDNHTQRPGDVLDFALDQGSAGVDK